VYALRRIVAYVLDMGLVLVPLEFLMEPADAYFREALPRVWEVYAGFFAFLFSMGVPILLVGSCVGATGWTPGKLVMFLRVAGRGGARPGLVQGLLRETVKAVAFSFILGGIFALYGIVTSGRTFYDDWLGLDVDDLRPTGLTDVQKNWRRQMREAQRQRAEE